jgi:hypothetical protein
MAAHRRICLLHSKVGAESVPVPDVLGNMYAHSVDEPAFEILDRSNLRPSPAIGGESLGTTSGGTGTGETTG